MDRALLPYRQNCEGYFFKEGLVLARKAAGYVQFPGGGVDKGETPEQALVRETQEETGVVVCNLRAVALITFDWGEQWAKIEKQKKRYEQFRGEQMRIFTGDVLSEGTPTDSSDAWPEPYWLPVDDVLLFLQSTPVDEELSEYRGCQLKNLLRHSSAYSSR